MSVSIDCPACGVPMKLTATVKMGETVKCNTCKANLEVIWLDPLELDILIDDEDDNFFNDVDEDEIENPYDDYEYSEESYDFDD